MTKSYVLLGFLIALSAHAGAESQCLKYNEDGVVLAGRVVFTTFFGPPNYGENPDTDSKEKQAILKLEQPICVNADPKTYEDAEASQAEVTLVPIQKIGFNQYTNKRIQVTGNLFHAISGHHHTPVLISVSQQPVVIQ